GVEGKARPAYREAGIPERRRRGSDGAMVEPRRAALFTRIPYQLRVVGLLYLAGARTRCGAVLLLVEARFAGVAAGRLHPAGDAAGGTGRRSEARGAASAGAGTVGGAGEAAAEHRAERRHDARHGERPGGPQ